jgi:tRNA threonylcarbamoyladenosine modification (KEOPS) complex Cgi121 subunit
LRGLRVYAKAYLCGRRLKPEDVKRKLTLANPGSLVQAAKAGTAKNEFFLEMLAAQTFQAQTTSTLLAKKPEIDFLLRLAGTTQIAKAIRDQGAKDGEPFLAVAAGRSELGTVPELAELRLPRRQLTKAELGKVERAALLSVQRP